MKQILWWGPKINNKHKTNIYQKLKQQTVCNEGTNKAPVTGPAATGRRNSKPRDSTKYKHKAQEKVEDEEKEKQES
jgi:hypothetical protein